MNRDVWYRQTSFHAFLKVALLSAALVTLFYILVGNVEIYLDDEGFMWYGTLWTALGQVPIRDFQAYDPGRYYWGAFWFKVFGDSGILSLRMSGAIFQFVGLTFGLMTLRRVFKSWLALAAAGFLLVIWMFPLWKTVEPVISLAAIYFAVLLIERPSIARHFIAGVMVGLAAFFGRNLGLYCFLAFLLLILFIWLKIDKAQLAARLSAWAAGVVVGYLPMLLMIAFIPGFYASFVESIIFLLPTKGTLLSMPVPWPWRPDYSQLTLRESLQNFAMGVLYLLMPLFYTVVGLILLLTKRDLQRKALLIACTFVGAFYLHYALARGQIYYLAWSIQPLLIGLLAFPYCFDLKHRKAYTIGTMAFLLVASSWAVWMFQPLHHPSKARSFIKATALTANDLVKGRGYHTYMDVAMMDFGLVRTDVAGDTLWIDKEQSDMINNIKAINQQFIPPDEGLFIAPLGTAFYPILHKRSPIWGIYLWFPANKSQQEKMIEELNQKKINWAFICDRASDDREEVRFRNTHPDVLQYLETNFAPVPAESMPAKCQLLQRK
jgi:hypothetical protein